MKRILVLYRELAGYFVNSMNYLADQHNVKIDIVAYPIKEDAPFRFEFSKNIRVIDRTNLTLLELQTLGKFDLIFCGGWADALYLNYVKSNSSIPSLLGFDKQWLGSLRDRLGAFYLKWKVRPLFDFAFVPGLEQIQFAERMGFEKPNVYSGAYTCNVDDYNQVYQRRIGMNQTPRRLIYAGRYAPEKGIDLLWSVFLELSDEFPDWELHCIGTGALASDAPNHPKIIHHGFLQGRPLFDVMASGELFVLPSLYEPWGVVVNEFAVAGYPLLLSNRVGARTGLLTDKNGWVFDYGSKVALKTAIARAMKCSREELKKMGQISHTLGVQLDESQYANSILEMMASH